MMSYYVALWFDEEAKKDLNKSRKIDHLADEYVAYGGGDPMIGLPDLSRNINQGDYAFLFYEKNQAIGFLREVFDLEYILEAKIGTCLV